MTHLAAVMRLDVFSMRPYLRQLTMLVSAMALVGVITASPTLTVFMASIYVTFIASYPFAVADKNHLDALYPTLPVERHTLVAGRYILITGVWVLMTVAALLLGAGATQIHGDGLTEADAGFASIGLVIGLAALLCAILVGLQLPIYYLLGHARAQLVAYVPVLLIVAATSGVGAVAGDSARTWLSGFSAPHGWMLGALAAFIMVGSCAVSVRLARHRSRL